MSKTLESNGNECILRDITLCVVFVAVGDIQRAAVVCRVHCCR